MNITIIAVILGAIASLCSIILFIKSITKNVKPKIKQDKIRKNKTLMTPFPIVKSPKGYLYFYERKPKKDRTYYCGNCYSNPSAMIPLEKTSNIFNRKLTCPACKTEYKR